MSNIEEEYQICKNLLKDSKQNPGLYCPEDIAQWRDTIDRFEEMTEEEVSELVERERGALAYEEMMNFLS